MIVGFDATAAVGESISGVGYHIIRLLEAMDRTAAQDVSFRVMYQAPDRSTRSRAEAVLPTSRRIKLVPLPFTRTRLGLLHRAFHSLIVPTATWRHGCNVFHGPAHVVPVIPRVPTVVTIHDMAFFRHAVHEETLLHALRAAVKASLNSAAAVIALSENTRRDIREIAGRADDVHVIYGAGNYATDAARHRQSTDPAKLRSMGVARRYVLYVGDFNPRKNLPYLIESFAHLKRTEEHGDLELVLAGNSRDARGTLESIAAGFGLASGDVVFPGRVSAEQLSVLYRNASAFALCSLMEGFTLVTLEAMSYGVPVVATSTSSIAEGTGDAAELVPLDSPSAVSDGLRSALTPGPRRDAMIRLGYERIRRFSWERAADETLALYRRVCGPAVR